MSARVLPKKIPTSKTGVFYKQIINEKEKEVDRIYLIRYKDETKKDKLLVIGKKSEGVTIELSDKKRMEIITKQRFGEEVQLLRHKRAKKVIDTLDSIAEIYFSDKETAPKSKSRYYNHIQPFFGTRDIKYIKKEEILEFQKALLKGSLKYPKNNRPVNLKTGKKSKQTTNNIIELLRTIYNYHIQEKGLKVQNPCTGVRKLNPDNARERFLTIDEIKQLFEVVKDNKPLWIFVKLSLQTGGRLETILNIKKKDIDLVNGHISLKNLKTNDTYKGFIQQDLLEYLKDYLSALKLNDYVVNIYDESIKTTSRQIQCRLKPKLDDLYNTELKKDDRKNRVVIHTLRHTFASHLAINGTPIFTIKELMNHRDIEQTMRYAKLAPDSGKNFVNGLYL